MLESRFRVGQIVEFARSAVCPSVGYKVLRVFPLEAGERHYRIKSISEPLERIANEKDLVDARVTIPWTSRLTLHIAPTDSPSAAGRRDL